MKLTFHGAAGSVTGSMHEIEVGGRHYLADCGMFQGRRKEAERLNRDFPVNAASLDAVILSHAHIDHSGRLPLLVKNGFAGPIYTTPATADLCGAMLPDTARILEGDAAFVNKHHPTEGRGDPLDNKDDRVEPLYNEDDAARAAKLFHRVPYRKDFHLGPGLDMEIFDAGHILGSGSIVFTSGNLKLAFSGDIGRPGLPIVRDPEPLPPVDFLIMESTYGTRSHPPKEDSARKLEEIVNRTIGRGGRLIVPAFAVGRTQQLVLLLHELMNAKRVESVPIFVDSPLAVNVTDIFRAHPECFDEETNRFLADGEDPFGFGRLRYVRSAEESKKLNTMKGPYIVISASGMCEAGRILHHLRNNVCNSRNTILLTGYQAENTLGRKLRDGWKSVRIFGIPTPVEAAVESLDALSGHADQKELLDWMQPMTPRLKRVFLVHGEPQESSGLAAAIRQRYGLEARPVAPGESFDLNQTI